MMAAYYFVAGALCFAMASHNNRSSLRFRILATCLIAVVVFLQGAA